MTRLHAAHQLLRLGPMRMNEFKEVTGWTYTRCRRTIDTLRSRGQVIRHRRDFWAVPGCLEAA